MSTDVAPEIKVHDDLDDWEMEGRPEPYVFRHSGRVWVTRNPMDVDWQEMMFAFSLSLEGRPGSFLKLMIIDWEEFDKLPLSISKLGRVMERITQHYGLGTPGGAVASPIS